MRCSTQYEPRSIHSLTMSMKLQIPSLTIHLLMVMVSGSGKSEDKLRNVDHILVVMPRDGGT